MSELDGVLGEIDKGQLAPVYLIWGEEFLVRKSAEELVKKLLPDASMGLNYSVLDGASPREVAMDLATMPMFPGRKVVLVRDPEFIAPKKGRGDALSKAREAWRAGRRKEGARRLLAIAARAGWGADDLDPSRSGAPTAEDWKEELNVDLADADLAFLKEVAAFCKEERITAPEGDATPLLDVFGKGLPSGQVLVIAASEVDPKNPLVQFAAKKGRVVERKVAAKLKDLDLSGLAAEVLAPYKKRMAGSAMALLKDRCGGNMRLVQSELEKLAQYVEGPTIQDADVLLLVGRAREEEFLELSDALQKRDLRLALRYVQDALGQDVHPLQLLGTIAGITRTLVENHERGRLLVQGSFPRSFEAFKDSVFPKIEALAKQQGQKVPHPYAAFAGMQAAAKYPRATLLRSLVACADADLKLKSGGGSLAIEQLLWTLCTDARA